MRVCMYTWTDRYTDKKIKMDVQSFRCTIIFLARQVGVPAMVCVSELVQRRGLVLVTNAHTPELNLNIGWCAGDGGVSEQVRRRG